MRCLPWALRRIGDKNVLSHVHIMLAFIATFAAIAFASHIVNQVPWADFVNFLNALVKTGNQQCQDGSIREFLTQPVFGAEGERRADDDLRLPGDWLITGLIWAEEYLPANSFDKEVDEDARCLELASTVRRRSIQTLRLGHKLALVRSLPESCTMHQLARSLVVAYHTTKIDRSLSVSNVVKCSSLPDQLYN